jgi:hypothetical protein
MSDELVGAIVDERAEGRVDAYEASGAVHNANADASDIEDRGQEIQIEIGVARLQAG